MSIMQRKNSKGERPPIVKPQRRNLATLMLQASRLQHQEAQWPARFPAWEFRTAMLAV